MDVKVAKKVRSWYEIVSTTDKRKSVYVTISKGIGEGAKTEAEALEEGKRIMIARGW